MYTALFTVQKNFGTLHPNSSHSEQTPNIFHAYIFLIFYISFLKKFCWEGYRKGHSAERKVLWALTGVDLVTAPICDITETAKERPSWRWSENLRLKQLSLFQRPDTTLPELHTCQERVLRRINTERAHSFCKMRLFGIVWSREKVSLTVVLTATGKLRALPYGSRCLLGADSSRSRYSCQASALRRHSFPRLLSGEARPNIFVIVDYYY